MRRQKRVRVLIAEDDFLVSEMVQGMLEEIGYTIIGKATSSQQAVDLTQRLRPDVVLMDIGMPDTDGIHATELIQASCPTPVVVLTAYETSELVERASVAGVGAYLVKPPQARDLKRAIIIAMARFDNMLELRRLNAELKARNQELQEALDQVRTLRGLIPICQACKKIRDDQGYWHQVEDYVENHSDAAFTHGLCPDCSRRLYPELYGDDGDQEGE
jgi:AmiR/NasT family two-component response regulator